jgi:hypothetical protein
VIDEKPRQIEQTREPGDDKSHMKSFQPENQHRAILQITVALSESLTGIPFDTAGMMP